jgi:hypothetical protein
MVSSYSEISAAGDNLKKTRLIAPPELARELISSVAEKSNQNDDWNGHAEQQKYD